MTDAVGYLRRSTSKQEQSLDGQRDAINRFASERGYRLIRWYIDDGISGSSGDERPQFCKMIDDASALSDFKVVIVYDLSRFGRMDGDETGHYRYRLRTAGVKVVFSNENDGGDDENGEIIRPVLQAQKRQYLRQISRDTLRGQTQAARAGWASGRAAAFGYDRMLVDETGKHCQRLKRGQKYAKPRSWHVALVPSDTPGEVDTLRWIYSSYVNGEIGCKEIARQLNEKSVAAPSGKPWCIGTIREILKNPLYKGWLCFGRRSEGKFHHLKNGEVSAADPAEGKIVSRPEEDWIVHRRQDLMIVAEDTWFAANRKLAERGNRSRRARARKLAYPFGGLIRCAECGAPMVGMRRDQKYEIYVCSTHFRNRSCKSNSVRQEALLKVTRDIIAERVFNNGDWNELKASFIRQAKQRPECRARDLEALKRQLNTARERYQRGARNLLLADPENVPALNVAMKEIRQNVQSLESELATAKENTDPAELAEKVIAQAKPLFEDLFSNDHQRLKAVLGAIVDHISLNFMDAEWGKRKVRLVAGGSISLRTTLTTGNRGDSLLTSHNEPFWWLNASVPLLRANTA